MEICESTFEAGENKDQGKLTAIPLTNNHKTLTQTPNIPRTYVVVNPYPITDNGARIDIAGSATFRRSSGSQAPPLRVRARIRWSDMYPTRRAPTYFMIESDVSGEEDEADIHMFPTPDGMITAPIANSLYIP